MTPHFDAATAEETIAAFVAGGAPSEELLSLLSEQHPLYAGRSANATTRIRGFILAAFEKAGLPEAALPYVLEELESGLDAYLVAAAARALRGTAADPRFIPFLRKAQENIRYKDAPVTFDSYKPNWPVANSTTAREEIRKTLASLGMADGRWQTAEESSFTAPPSAIRHLPSDCCEMTFSPDRSRVAADLPIDFQDQDGRTIRFRDFFRDKLSVVAFFYTRCDNPEKCSLTVTKLARLAEAIESGPLHGRVRVAAITYDPAYDFSDRIKRYGENRGIRFNDDVRFLRTPDHFDALRSRFDLGVNYGDATVNRHRIELYVLDARSNIVATFTRMQWDVAAVLAELETHLSKWKTAFIPLPAILLALLPKCPLCVGAYFTAFGLGGLQFLAQRAWTIPITTVFLLLNVWLIWRRARRTHNILAIALSSTGALILWMGMFLAGGRAVAIVGALLIVAASIASTSVQTVATAARESLALPPK
jgi:protein SCO1/2